MRIQSKNIIGIIRNKNYKKRRKSLVQHMRDKQANNSSTINMNKILIIDDDVDTNVLLKRLLTKHGFEVETASSGMEGSLLVASFKPNLVLSDYRLGDMDGATLLLKIKKQSPDTPVIIMTGYSDIRKAINAIRLGAFDYVTKPLIPDEILLNIRTALSLNGSLLNKSELGKVGKPKGTSSYLLTGSSYSKKLEDDIALVAPTNYSVIIHGESGVGKEGAARLIHEKSNRNTRAFVSLDCGALSRELAGSELFGHEQGAFTGALMQKIGLFERAAGGTLFLDEVANLSYEVQTLLLRVIQEREMRRIGGTKTLNIDVRIIVASNELLTENIRTGSFREDLYHRLNEFTVKVPPLRERREDILFFATHFLKEAAANLEKTINGFEPAVEQIFLNYPWYGNIRELKNVVRRAALLSTGKVDIASLPFEIMHPEKENPGLTDAGSSMQDVVQISESENDRMKRASFEAQYDVILDALTKSDFNKTKAAQLLGIHRKTLYNKMKHTKEDKSKLS